jgi:hypothetical protein
MMAAKCRRVKLPCFGRMPRPAEWPALVLAASLVSTAVLDRAYALRPPRSPDDHTRSGLLELESGSEPMDGSPSLLSSDHLEARP